MVVTRELVITYGAYTVPNIDGHILLERSKDEGSLTFSFIVQADTEAAFVAAVVAAEAAFQKPYQAFSVVQGGETLLDGSVADRDVLDPIATIEKQESVADTGRSRRYTVRIEFGLPADTGAEPVSGMRDSSVEVSYTPERIRIVTLSGTFTGVGASSARTVYEAQIDGYAAGILTGLGITAVNSEIDSEPQVTSDLNDDTCTYTRVYRELIFSQAGSTLDDSDLVRQRLTITRRQEGPGDTLTAERLATLDLSYDVSVDKDQTTELRNKYAEIRDWLLTQVQNTLDGGQFAVTMEEPRYDYDENRISVRWTVVGQPDGEIVIENRVTTEDDDDLGIEILPVWSGRATDAYTWNGPRVIIRSVRQSQKRVGTFTEQDAISFGASELSRARARHPYQANGGTWVIITRMPGATPLRMGIGNDTMDVTELSLVTRMRYVTQPASFEGGTGGGVITPSSGS